MRRSIALGVCLLVTAPAAARAQDTPLSDLLVNLIRAEVRLAPPAVGISHEAHFLPDPSQRLTPDFFNRQLITQLGTFPIGSPSGGFSYDFDSSTGTFQRTSESFGPAFAERALTIGRNKVSVGVNYQYSKYSTFEGQDLDNGDIKFYLRHTPFDSPPAFFEGDVVEAALRLDVSSSTTTFFANYGVLDNWDFAIAVPIQRVKMDAAIDATVLRLATSDAPTIHVFPNRTASQTFSDSGSASGIGDVLFRTKYRLLSTPGGGLAIGLDLRVPTGDQENLLGTGARQGTVTLIGSSTAGQWAPHFNVGFTGSESDDNSIPNEWGYRFGADFVAAPRVTLAVDFVGRTLLKAGRLDFGSSTIDFVNPTTGRPDSITVTELQVTSESVSRSLNLSSLAVGGKFNVGGNLLINANVLFSLMSRGVTARFTPVIGVDYSF